MTNQYTSSFEYVSNGDTTTETPEDLTAEHITIMNPEIRWEGSEDTGSSTSYSTNTNTTTAQASEDVDTEYDTSTNDDSDAEVETIQPGDTFSTSLYAEADFPEIPSGYELDYLELTAEVYADFSAEFDGVYTDIGGQGNGIDTTANETVVVGDHSGGTSDSAGQTRYIDTDVSWENDTGEERSMSVGASIELTTHSYKEEVTVEPDTSSTSYPSVPSGYSFSRHYYREEINGSWEDSGYSYSNSVGDSRSITSDDPDNEWSLEMRTRGSDTTYYTEYTDDPSVSGDVSASHSGSLSDSETSGWYTLNGFDLGSNSINHSISDSNQGYYQIRFDWDYLPPEAPTNVSASGPDL